MSALAVITRPAVHSSDDRDLVAAVRDGDDRAFELLFERYHVHITAYVRGMVHDHGRAEDVTQEVFIAALRRIRATDSEIVFKPWIFEIAKNACIDAFRRGRNTHEVSFDADGALGPADQRRLVAGKAVPDAEMDTKLALDDLCGAFGGLSQTHHDILVMREFDGLSYREIGERLSMTQGGVESTLFRARRRLGEEYQEISSGERCMRVRGIVDSSAPGSLGVRERRRMCRHVSHCQPCRRYALRAGVDIGQPNAPSSRIARVAALLPLPAFLRRRSDVEQAGQLMGSHTHAVSIVSVLDPAAVSGWGKAIIAATAATVAGLGAGAAVDRGGLSADAGRTLPALTTPSQQRSAVNPDAPSAQSGPRGTPALQQPSRGIDPAPGAGDPAPGAGAPDVRSERPPDAAPPPPKRPPASPVAPDRPASGTAPLGPDATSSTTGPEKTPAAKEPQTGPLQQLLNGGKDPEPAAEKPRPGIVSGVVGLLQGGAATGAGKAPDASLHTSGGDGSLLGSSTTPSPEPIAEVKPVKIVVDLVDAVTAGTE